MIDLTQFLTVGGLGALLMIIVQVVKMQLPERFLGYLPYGASLVGIILALLFAWATNNLGTPALGVSYGLTGFLAGLTSVGLYQHTLDKLPPPKEDVSGTIQGQPLSGLTDGHNLPPWSTGNATTIPKP